MALATEEIVEKKIQPVKQLKIAYIMSRFPKLTETFILYELMALRDEGVEVEIFPLLREKQSVAHPEADRLGWAGSYAAALFFSVFCYFNNR